jgi:branched-chain amino acid transport system permease protein
VYLPMAAGQLSLATPAFYAVGGTLAALLSTQGSTQSSIGLWAVLGEMLLAAGLTAGLALLVGLPVLRLRGIYLAIATIALVEIVRVAILNLPFTGGAAGIFGIPQPFQQPLGYVLFSGGVLAVCWRCAAGCSSAWRRAAWGARWPPSAMTSSLAAAWASTPPG